ncbi:hypothetical protein C8R44DRAFT_982654 [Mycena epipterygia]|nr:hypothetical protein C8R44DRAFT_982654 [Mycena epipterygia]
MAHSKATINNNTVSAVITLNKNLEYFFCWATATCGQRTLAPLSCVGEVFLSTGKGDSEDNVRLAGSAVMDEFAEPLCQVKNSSGGKGPATWFETGDSSFVSLRIRRAKILASNDGREVLDYLDSNTPFVTFKFIFVGSKRAVHTPARQERRLLIRFPATEAPALQKEIKAPTGRESEQRTGHDKNLKRKAMSSEVEDVKSDVGRDDSPLTSLGGSSESSRSPSREMDERKSSEPHRKRLRQGKVNTAVATSSSGNNLKGGEVERLKAEMKRNVDLKKLETMKDNAEMEEMLGIPL